MIFVTVGTHEQPFNRLIEEIDKLKGDGIIKEEVIIQKGFSNYEPKYCESYKLIGYDEMQKYLEKANIIITHGGPASFIAPLSMGKVPIVVPRQKEYNEHVNNHQVDFVKQVVERTGSIIPVYDINDLKNAIVNYKSNIKKLDGKFKSNNKDFCNNLNKLFESLIG